ncbi:hypothetical protein CXG81DRAFT_20304 [Caulochytrium protostelioides]|uniref:Uncharacterized protein n=1 Tax=Caulochytrium protostelioides TaxID=1555241 RepID=A0A4P9X3N6_9FUNG|nr:hypothetical protein CXG81DRAFT_20304 [Caulochytrium protostelioides]|eukprot:RKO99634.1 hypothetical protein CXG81DRAFT_20304 [Caulochytrium protostelioides]
MVALAASHGTAFTCYEGDNWMQCANMGAVAATNDIGPNPRYMFETRNVLDISLRVVALTVLAVDVILFVYSFYPRRHSPSAILIATMLFLQVIGVLCQFITKVDLCPPALLSAHIYVAVACMMVSAELYNWVIYLRFTLVTSLSGWFRWLASAFLMLETTASIVAYGVTAYGYATQGRFGVDRSLGTSIYSIVAICQAFYALALSAHFIFTFYIPVIRLYRPDVPMLALVMNDGLAYIIAECLLHCVFTIAYYFERRYYSSGSQLASSLRYGLFLLFIRRMRMTIRQKDTDQSCHWPTADDVDPHPGHGHLHLHYDADDTGSPRPRRGSHDTDSTTPVAYVANSVGGGGVTTSTHGTIHRDLPNEVRRIGGFGSGIASPLVSGISGTGGTSGRGATGTTSGIASGIASGAAGHRWSLGHGAPYKPEMVWPAPFGPDCAPAKSVAGDWVARAMAARAAMLQAADVAAAAAALTPNPDGAAVAAAAAAAAPGLRDPLDGLRPPSPWSRIGSGPGGRAVDAAVAVPVEGMSSVVYNPKTGPAAPATLGGLAGRRSPTPPTSPPPPPVPTLLGGEGLPPCLAFVQAPLAPRPPPAAPASSDPPPGSTSPATAPDPLHGRPADPTAATTMIPLAAATPVASLSFGYDLVAPLTAEDHGFPLSSTIRDHAWGPQPQPPPLSGTAAPAAAAAGVDAGAAAGAGAGASADADLARTRRSWGSAVGRRLSALSAPSEPESDAATGHGPPRGHDPSAGLRIDGAGASNAPADTFAWAPSPSPSLGGLLWSSSASPTPSARPLGPSSGVGGGAAVVGAERRARGRGARRPLGGPGHVRLGNGGDGGDGDGGLVSCVPSPVGPRRPHEGFRRERILGERPGRGAAGAALGLGRHGRRRRAVRPDRDAGGRW